MGLLFVESAKADRGRYPWGKGLRVKRRVEGPSSQGGRAWEARVEAAKRLLLERLFGYPHSAPLRAAPAPATTARAAVSAQPGTAVEKASLGPEAGRQAGRQATVVRVSRR